MNNKFDLYLERIDPVRNMRRFYTVSVGRSLFGEPVLIRRWGRIGSFGQEKLETCASEQEALSRLLALTQSKRKRDYRPPSKLGQ